MRRPLLFSTAALPVIVGIWLALPGGAPPAAPTRQGDAISCERIVSLAPSITESLFAVGLGPQVVGVTRYCAHPEAVTALPEVGGYVDPNLAAIVALDPTVVVLLAQHQIARDRLTTLGIPTIAVDQTRVTDILDTLDTLGTTCGSDLSAEAVLRDLRTRMTRIAAAVAPRRRESVLIAMGRNMGTGGIKDVYIAGEESYYTDLIQIAGGRNAYGGKVPFPIISREGMMRLSPTVIIDMVPDLATQGWSEEALLAEWRQLPVPAVRDGRIHIFSMPYSVVPGPRFILTLEAMAAVIHPEVPWKQR